MITENRQYSELRVKFCDQRVDTEMARSVEVGEMWLRYVTKDEKEHLISNSIIAHIRYDGPINRLYK